MKEPKELSPIEAAREIEYELLTQKLRNIVQAWISIFFLEVGKRIFFI